MMRGSFLACGAVAAVGGSWRGILLSAATILLCVCDRGSCYDFAVQPKPIEFLRIPESQTVVAGETVRLSCNITIIKLDNNYPVPHLVWRFNGTTIRQPAAAPKENDKARGYFSSELVIESASEADSGFYECVAVDGKRRRDWTGNGSHIISSPRADVQVVSLDDFPDHSDSSGSGSILEPYGMETVTLQYGEPYVVPCDLGQVGISSHISWFQNGTLSNQKIVLVNGSLLLPAATAEDSGIYHCSLQIGNDTVDGQTFNIQVSAEPYQGQPYLATDLPLTAPLLPGGHLTIHCYVLGALATPTTPPLRVEVLEGGRPLFSVSPDEDSPYKRLYVTRTGEYQCRLVVDGGQEISTVTINVVPGYEATSAKEVVFVGDMSNGQTLNCAATGDGDPYRSLYWYRNGKPLEVGGAGYALDGSSPDLEKAVYQCFVVSRDGVIHQSSWRVFDSRELYSQQAIISVDA
jgi:hypothetical protein